LVVQLPLDKMSIDRNEAVLALRAKNVGASIHYAPLHPMPLYRDNDRGALPVTEQVANSILTLPISASMTVDDARYVCDCFAELFTS
jgi:dTDP-4-amino-4,6-dideoxygalactose transaminase